MTNTRVTPVADLRPQDAVRLYGLTVIVHAVETGLLVYRGREFEVVYLTGASAEGPVRTTLPKAWVLVASR